MDQLTEVYKTRGDALEAVLDKVEDELRTMLQDIGTVRQMLSENDKRYGLTQGKGSVKEMCDTLRRNFPAWAHKSDDELMEQFKPKQ